MTGLAPAALSAWFVAWASIYALAQGVDPGVVIRADVTGAVLAAGAGLLAVVRRRGLVASTCLVVAATLGTAAVVAVSGLIGFVGLVVPHMVRLMAGSSYRVVIPLAVTIGASFLILADIPGRTLSSPAEVPIGVVTAFIGAPFFIVLLRTRQVSR